MGRWAQRKRSGGGITPLNYILRAQVTDVNVILLTYAANVDASTFDVFAFTSSPSGAFNVITAPFTNRKIELTMSAPLAGDDKIQYVANKPGFQPNQQKQYD